MRRALFLWLPVALYMAAIFYVSSLPQPPVPPGGDKPWHLLAYFGLGVLTTGAVAGGLAVPIGSRTAVLAMAIAIAYGATDEFHQLFVPGRSAQLADLVADAIGVVIGTSLCWILAWALHKSQGTRHRRHGTRRKAPATKHTTVVADRNA
jgi:VanZ family protein